ncbi:MAG: metallopeptidase family protein [Chloroflexaceae bacterium]|nr:metallopeptidase family protein [Chloroflexaceae bacterium]
MTTDDFEQLVVQVLDTLPARFEPYLENVEFLIEQRPSPKQLQAVHMDEHESLYGLYEGIPLTERTSFDFAMPSIIILFQEPLERDFPAEWKLRDEVRRTVLHELAHHFGISDERLEELGAY